MEVQGCGHPQKLAAWWACLVATGATEEMQGFWRSLQKQREREGHNLDSPICPHLPVSQWGTLWVTLGQTPESAEDGSGSVTMKKSEAWRHTTPIGPGCNDHQVKWLPSAWPSHLPGGFRKHTYSSHFSLIAIRPPPYRYVWWASGGSSETV